MIKWLLQIQFGVSACVVLVSVQICLRHNLFICAWISIEFGTVVILEEGKCLLKHLFR